MSNFLDKLLDGAKVEWKPLGDVAEIKRGTSITKKNITLGNVPVIAGGRKPAYFHNVSNRNGETIVIAGSGAYAGFVSWWDKPIFVSDAFTIKPDNIFLPKYCYHFLMSMQKQLHDLKSGGGVPHVYPRDIAPIKIPIPCPDNPKKSLEIQAEIVRILDSFTKLTTELTKELTARKKQYEYYRDKLLTFNEDEVEWKPLGEITLSTSNIQWKETNRIYRYIDLTSVNRKNNSIMETSEITAKNAPSRAKKMVQEEDVIFATTRPTQLRLCLINDKYSGEVASTGYCVLRAKINVILPKWIYYHLSSADFFNYVEENQSGSAYPAISDSIVKKFKIPIPSLAEQSRIVAILDKFDALTNSISEGLPREIELRQKQYEYYRDLLLNFSKSKLKSQKLKDVLNKTTNSYNTPFILVTTLGKVGFNYYTKPFVYKNGMWAYYTNNPNINVKYVYYFLKNKEIRFRYIASKMFIPSLNHKDTDNFKIYVPKIEAQNEIVETLDNLKAPINNFTYRKKQYEYYRDLLLNFPKKC